MEGAQSSSSSSTSTTGGSGPSLSMIGSGEDHSSSSSSSSFPRRQGNQRQGPLLEEDDSDDVSREEVEDEKEQREELASTTTTKKVVRETPTTTYSQVASGVSAVTDESARDVTKATTTFAAAADAAASASSAKKAVAQGKELDFSRSSSERDDNEEEDTYYEPTEDVAAAVAGGPHHPSAPSPVLPTPHSAAPRKKRLQNAQSAPAPHRSQQPYQKRDESVSNNLDKKDDINSNNNDIRKDDMEGRPAIQSLAAANCNEPNSVSLSTTTTPNISALVIKRWLPVGYEPTEWDVICGRGKGSYSHLGNSKLRSIIQNLAEDYSACGEEKQAKGEIVKQVLRYVQNPKNAQTKQNKKKVDGSGSSKSDPEKDDEGVEDDGNNDDDDHDEQEQAKDENTRGSFLRRHPHSDQWYEIPDAVAREKISSAFRDCFYEKYSSTYPAKKRKRDELIQEHFESMANPAASPPTARSLLLAHQQSQPPPGKGGGGTHAQPQEEQAPGAAAATVNDAAEVSHFPPVTPHVVLVEDEDNNSKTKSNEDQDSSSTKERSSFFPSDFKPSAEDVLLSSSTNKYVDHPGNIEFHDLIKSFMPTYSKVQNETKRIIVAQRVLDRVWAQGGRFLKRDARAGRWEQVSDSVALSTSHRIFQKFSIIADAVVDDQKRKKKKTTLRPKRESQVKRRGHVEDENDEGSMLKGRKKAKNDKKDDKKEEDESTLVTSLEMEAHQGDAESQYKLAVWYLTGKLAREDKAGPIASMTSGPMATEKNLPGYEHSAFWLKKAAYQGHTHAQYELATSYHFGDQGLSQNMQVAVHWYCKAAARYFFTIHQSAVLDMTQEFDLNHYVSMVPAIADNDVAATTTSTMKTTSSMDLAAAAAAKTTPLWQSYPPQQPANAFSLLNASAGAAGRYGAVQPTLPRQYHPHNLVVSQPQHQNHQQHAPQSYATADANSAGSSSSNNSLTAAVAAAAHHLVKLVGGGTNFFAPGTTGEAAGFAATMPPPSQYQQLKKHRPRHAPH